MFKFNNKNTGTTSFVSWEVMDKNLSKSVKILILEQIAFSAVFYFRQAFVFFVFLQSNQQKGVRMVSTNNM